MRLEAGDVAFFGYGPEGPYTLPIGIEYKTAREALQSMQNGRLTGEQLPKMAALYKRVYIVLEGEYGESPEGILQFRCWREGKPFWSSFSHTKYRAFDNWLNSLSEVGRVIIKRTLDRSESASVILNLYHFWAKDYEQHKSAFKLDKSQEPAVLPRVTNERAMIARIPGVGDELSGRVAAHFSNNVHTAVNAEVTEWMKIPGIGKVKAQKIFNFLRRL